MRVALVVPYYDEGSPEEPASVLARQHTLPGLIGALARRGTEVRGFQLHGVRQDVRIDGGLVEFHPAGTQRMAAARFMHRRFPRHGPAYWLPATGLWRAVRRFRPEVVHTFGADLDINLPLAALVAHDLGARLVVSYHGGLPPRDRTTRTIRRFALSSADRVAFTARAQAIPWLAAGLVREDQILEVMETSTLVARLPRAEARHRSGVEGDPACVMASRLHPVKDPVTALTGFAILAERSPRAHLHVFPASSELLSVCRGLIASVPVLRGRVTLQERVPPDAMADVLSAADYLIQASTREWSGLVVMEAMACGAIPVVTDIPSFRRMTDGGLAGRLFRVGDPRGLADAVTAVEQAGRDAASQTVRARFADALSFDALARTLSAAYASDAYPDVSSSSAA